MKLKEECRRTVIGQTLLILSLSLLPALAASRSLAAVERGSRWLVSTADLSVGDVNEFWLTTNARNGVSIRVSVPDFVFIGLAQSGCRQAALNGHEVTWKGDIAQGEPLRFCVRPDRRGSFRVLAAISSGTSPPAEFLQSDLVRAKGSMDLGTAGSTLLSALTGFVFGIVTLVVQRAMDARNQIQKDLQSTQSELVKALGPDLVKNVNALNGYLASETVGAPTLQTSGYNLLSKKALAFLERSAKREYLVGLEELNTAINDYNYQVAANADRSVLMDAARAVLARANSLADERKRN
jgi:hypothetical protein